MSDHKQQQVGEKMKTGLKISESHMNEVTQGRCINLAMSLG